MNEMETNSNDECTSSVCDALLKEPTTTESTLTITANEDDNDASEAETIDKCTQVTYCALHKTFLTLRAQSSDTRGPSVATVENEEDGTEDDIVKAEDDGYGEEAKEEDEANEEEEAKEEED